MANRFPLIVDSSGTAAIKELASGDNLDLTGNGIVGVGTVALTNLTVGGAQGSDGQVLTSTGSGVQWENAAAGGISDVVSDTSPQLGGNLDVNGQDIVTTSNGDIDLDPNGSGVVVFKGNATKGAGQFKLNCEANSHGIIIKGPPHSAAASYTLTLPNTDGNADQVLKTDGSGNLDWVDSGGGGGGVWNVISSQTISSSVSSVTFTGVTGYKVYKLIMTDINHSSSGTADQIQLSSDNGSSFATFGISSIALRYNSGSTSQTFNNDFYQSNKLPLMYSFNEYNNDEKHHVEVTIFGLNDSSFTYTHSRLLSNWGWNTNDIGVNETYARTHGSGGLASFNAFKVDAMAGGTYDGGTFTLYGLANS